MGKQLNLNFHQTFKPEKQYICSILSIADAATEMEVRDISACTGIPNGKSSGKVEPHINYAKYMGLVDVVKNNGKYILSKTRLGEIVFAEDPGLQENLTILICHLMIVREYSGAAMWSTLFRSILPRYYSGIDKDILLKELDNELSGKVTIKNAAPLFSSYDDMFSGLNIIAVDDKRLSLKSLQYDKEYIYLYALALFEYWDEIYLDQKEISSVQLQAVGFGKCFGWNEMKEYEILEYLSDKGIIRLNRQLAPYTILRFFEKDEIIEKLYSQLC